MRRSSSENKPAEKSGSKSPGAVVKVYETQLTLDKSGCHTAAHWQLAQLKKDSRESGKWREK